MIGEELNERIREVIVSTHETDPSEIARQVKIKPTEAWDVIEILLRHRVLEVMGAMRRNAVVGSPIDADEPASGRAARSAPGPSRWSRYSRELLDATVHVPNAGMKRIGACTASELAMAADEYAARAQANLDREQFFRDLAAQLKSSGARCLDDLERAPKKKAA